ncbi:DNA helicase [Burkholderia cepacia]|uniref:DEAD/DEAH box helicase n=1 Tax=Burkholderia cepacia TaxID=292 RepID=UPI00075AA433|nr:ATP-binding domain-containing protein [Burkholderia cepacia]KWC74557.1 DNA helicase [Burkholderia cepacia]
MTSLFYLQAQENDTNHTLLSAIREYCEASKQQAYVVDRPLGDSRYDYDFKSGLVVLMPKHQITFVNLSDNEGAFEGFVDDFVEDLGSISDKFRYKDVIGRPRAWRDLIATVSFDPAQFSMADLVEKTYIEAPDRQRVCELLISLLTGSINDVETVKAEIPQTLLDKVKQKILLFDGDQTRFIYEQLPQKAVKIQGLSGTGKTELLLHKLKELYVGKPDCRIAFTCHNRILADNLRRRIPDFFNFMKVEQQIKWNERLWCTHAWGSQNDVNSGIYRYICDKYGLTYNRWSPSMPFAKACAEALRELGDREITDFAFDYVFIDESQDFPESFFELCQRVTKETAFIAGDIFQSIFDEQIADRIDPDYLLSKCYRTDPRTLMFAHSLGMGLFEPTKLRWLKDNEWEACGYIIEKSHDGSTYDLKREPLRRFEDLEQYDVKSVEVVTTGQNFIADSSAAILKILGDIRAAHPTVSVDDIGIIFLDAGNSVYKLADMLEQLIPRQFGWTVNKAYESKQKTKDSLFVSNKNNVKGLEFPFVICVAGWISSAPAYRNALYMTLTRSFIQTYLVVATASNEAILPAIEMGLNQINAHGYLTVTVPRPEEMPQLQTTITHNATNVSFYDFMQDIFDELDVLALFRPPLLEITRTVVGEKFDYESTKELVAFNYAKMRGATA